MADPRVTRANTAARAGADGQAPQEEGRQGNAAPGGAGGTRHRGPARIVVAVVSALVIAFCAWSMSEYVQGRDPLAFLGGTPQEAATAGPEDSGGGTDVASSSATGASSAGRLALTADDVLDEVSGPLSFDGEDVSVPADDLRVVVSEDGVWVEQEGGEDASERASLTARRAAALAAWLDEQGAPVPQVTWLSEGADGMVRAAVSYAVGEQPASGTTARLLAAARGYALAGDVAEAAGEGVSASAGEAPCLPDGTAVVVGGSSDGTGGGSGGGVDGSGASGTALGTAASDGTAPAQGGSGQGTGGSGASRASTITVTVSVSGSSRRVSLPAGSTALDALLATGASVETGANPAGGGGSWVYAINGLGQDSAHGWTYAVNGSLPGVMSDQYALADGDAVSWSYVSS